MNRIHDRWGAPRALSLGERDLHVWRVRLRERDPREVIDVLSADEHDRARRFYHERDATAYTVAHGMLRLILARYDVGAPNELRFAAGEFGKPTLIAEPGVPLVEFNLSHSRDLALIAVTRAGPIGVDVEAWDRDIEHLDLAEHFFSSAERSALRALAADLEATTEGFFNAWTRKEAYLKATGYGITRGLHHFDVTLAPHEPAALLADRLDPSAPQQWRIAAFEPGDEYAGAVVASHRVSDISLFDAD